MKLTTLKWKRKTLRNKPETDDWSETFQTVRCIKLSGKRTQVQLFCFSLTLELTFFDPSNTVQLEAMGTSFQREGTQLNDFLLCSGELSSFSCFWTVSLPHPPWCIWEFIYVWSHLLKFSLLFPPHSDDSWFLAKSCDCAFVCGTFHFQQQALFVLILWNSIAAQKHRRERSRWIWGSSLVLNNKVLFTGVVGRHTPFGLKGLVKPSVALEEMCEDWRMPHEEVDPRTKIFCWYEERTSVDSFSSLLSISLKLIDTHIMLWNIVVL